MVKGAQTLRGDVSRVMHILLKMRCEILLTIKWI